MSKRKGGGEKSKDAEEKRKLESTAIEATHKVNNFFKPLLKSVLSVKSVRGLHHSTSNDIDQPDQVQGIGNMGDDDDHVLVPTSSSSATVEVEVTTTCDEPVII